MRFIKIQSEREETDAGNLQAKYATGLYIALWKNPYGCINIQL